MSGEHARSSRGGPAGRVPAEVSREWGPWAWLLVMAIIGAVQLVRQQWFAAGLFLLAAIVMGVDLVHTRAARAMRPAHGERATPPTGRDRGWHLPLTVLLPAAAVAAVALTALTRHSGAMAAALVPLGVVVLVLGWSGDRLPGPEQRWPVALRRLAWAWAAIWIAGGLWELAQVLLVNLGQDPAAVPLSDLLDPVLADRAGQGVFVVVWLLAGVYLLRRGRPR